MWRSSPRALGIETTAVPADNLDPRMLLEPFGGPSRGAIRQHVNYLSPLQVDHDRPAGRALSPTPVVDADHPKRCTHLVFGHVALQMPQDGIVAGRNGQAFHQSLRGSSTGRMAEQPYQFGDAMGPAGQPSSGRRQLLHTSLSPASTIAAAPAAKPELQDHGRTLNRQILQSPIMPAVPRSRLLGAIGAAPIPST